jgi:hypothetical protein
MRRARLYYLGMPIDVHGRLEVPPASVSFLRMAGGSPRLLLLNETFSLPGKAPRCRHERKNRC